MSYILRPILATASCRGYCTNYTYVPRRYDGQPYNRRGVKYCATCEYRFCKTDWSTFPNPKYCVCCKKQMRVRKKQISSKFDWRPRVE